MNKLSIVIPVYFNQESLIELVDNIKQTVIDVIDAEVELVLVDDGSNDNSWDTIKAIVSENTFAKGYKLSRNFGSHSAILCGLSKSTGDCVAVKAADLQEPTELIVDMYSEWLNDNNVVIALREEREENVIKKAFANIYYYIVGKIAIADMPRGGFDIFLIDRKVIEVLERMDERNSTITGQILWCGFSRATVSYTRKKRKHGKSRWTLRKKIKLFMDTLFNFTSLPISIVTFIGGFSFVGSIVWALVAMIMRISGRIVVPGWTTLFMFNLFSFGILMLTLGLLGGYLWRTFDASKNRPSYIVEEECEDNEIKY